MRSDLNELMLSGTAAADAIEAGEGGKARVEFTLASTSCHRARPKDGQQGEIKTFTSYVPCVCFGRAAQAEAARIEKGDRVVIKGEIRQSSWTDVEGTRRSRWSVICSWITRCVKEGQASDAGREEQTAADGAPGEAVTPAPAAEAAPRAGNGRKEGGDSKDRGEAILIIEAPGGAKADADDGGDYEAALVEALAAGIS